MTRLLLYLPLVLGKLNPNLCLTHIRALWLDSAFFVSFGRADLTPSMSRAAWVTGAQTRSWALGLPQGTESQGFYAGSKFRG